MNRTTRTEFNEDGLTTAKELAYDTANAARTEYTYNEDGNMTLLEDPLQNETSWDYDSVGREIEMTDPLQKTVYKTYDDDGRLASILSRNNLLRTFAYDEEGRVETEKWYDGPSDTDPVVQTYSWSYDEQGRLESAGNDVGDYTFKYDHTGQLTEVENPFGVVLYFKYDDRGFRTLVEDSFGGSVASDYNDAGELLSRLYTATNQPTLRIDLEYDDLGRVTTQTRYSDAAGTTVVATSEYSYDESGRLESLEHRDAVPDLIADYVWDWDAVGQLISQTDHGVTREYDYDEQGQLISEDIDENLTEWDYDFNGNRNTTGYTVGTGNRILSDGVWDYSYDDEGNLTEKDEINGDLRWTYGYDHANQLVEVKSYDGQSLLDEILFRYDVFGNRVEKEVNPAPVGPSELIERYVYDGWNPLKPAPIGNENWDVVIDINDMGSLTRRYLRGDVVDELFARIEGTTDALWLLGDHLGSIRDVIDDSGNPVKSVEYDAWGNIISQSGTGELGRYTYTSREWDVETQLQYNRARYYDPALGRWITQDPIEFEAGDSNLYRYVNNDPIDNLDPSGLRIVFWYNTMPDMGDRLKDRLNAKDWATWKRMLEKLDKQLTSAVKEVVQHLKNPKIVGQGQIDNGLKLSRALNKEDWKKYDEFKAGLIQQITKLGDLQSDGYAVAYRPAKPADKDGVVRVPWNEWKNRLWPMNLHLAENLKNPNNPPKYSNFVQVNSENGPFEGRDYPNMGYVTHERRVINPDRPNVHNKPIVHFPPWFLAITGDRDPLLKFIDGPGYQLATLAHELIHAFGPQLEYKNAEAGSHDNWSALIIARDRGQDFIRTGLTSATWLGNVFWGADMKERARITMQNILRLITKTPPMDRP